ncbi:MAG: thioredoxin domain-containing protein [Acidobacteriota bacterium]|nr:MAG: thioredoxin domain-containing protein [Acidobacteriota bacterium]
MPGQVFREARFCAAWRRGLALSVLVICCGPALRPSLAGDTPVQPEHQPAASPVAPARVEWHSFTPAAFRRALVEDRLILLVLEMPWSPAVADARREVWADEEVARQLQSGYVAIRERADLRPDLVRRYAAPGWPATSILLPDGRPLYVLIGDGIPVPRRLSTGYVPAAEMSRLLSESIHYYRAAKDKALAISLEQSDRSVERARPGSGKPSESLVWRHAQQMRLTFDVERRYVGGPPRLPLLDLIELMLTLSGEAEDPWRLLGTSSLETLAARLTDPADGGLYRMAGGLDWEDPQKEKLLDRNARFLELLALAYRVTARRTYRERGLKLAAWIDASFSAKDGAFFNAVCETCPEGRDDVVITASNALAATALIRAGCAFGDGDLVRRGLAAARFVREKRYRAGRGVPRAVIDGVAVPPGNLVLDDQVHAAETFVTAYEATGRRDWLAAARDIARSAVANLVDSETGALMDTIPRQDAPVPLRSPVFPLKANAEMVRVLVRLFYLDDSRFYVKTARQILTSFAGDAGEMGLDRSAYALAAYDFHLPPITVHVVESDSSAKGDALRRAGMSVAHPFVTVRSWDQRRDRDELLGLGIAITADPGLYFLHSGIMSRRESNPSAARGAAQDLRETVLRRDRVQRGEEEPPPDPADMLPRRGGR